MTVRILTGDCRDVLKTLGDESVHCVVTSPPYFGLRSYLPPDHPNKANEVGTERYYGTYVSQLVGIFDEVRRVLRDDGTLWLNLGDSYATGAGAVGERPGGGAQGDRWIGNDDSKGRGTPKRADGTGGYSYVGPMTQANRLVQPGLKPKDLMGMPWRVAFALQTAGWYLRSDIIWHKPAPMPESVTDRPTKSHEYLFLLSKNERYYYDAAAIAEPAVGVTQHDLTGPGCDAPGQTSQAGNRSWKGSTFDGPRDLAVRPDTGRNRGRASGNKSHKGVAAYEASDTEEHRTKAGLLKISDTPYAKRNKRSVWTVASEPFSEAHFATFPPGLIEPCILAGCPEGGTVLDPFGGAGTTAMVADRLGRDAILIELNPEYAAMAERRIRGDAGMFANVAAE